MSSIFDDNEDYVPSYSAEATADSEADAEMDANNAAAEAAIQEMTAKSSPQVQRAHTEDDIEVNMDDVDQRLDVAACYRELIGNPLFNGDDDNTRIVETEIRRFVNVRLKELLGVKPDSRPLMAPTKPLFSDAEAQSIRGLLAAFGTRELEILKALAASALRHKVVAPPTSTPEPPKPRPTLRRAQAPQPEPRPAPAPVVAPPPPIQVQQPAPRPSTRPVGRPRGSVNRTAPATQQTAPAKPTPALTKKVVQEINGQEHITEVPIITKHPGRVPFPQTDRDFIAASESFAGQQARSQERNKDNEGKTGVGF